MSLSTKDQLGREVHISSSRRIISLVPSITELLFDLDLGNEIVGVTRFCVHPASARQTKATIGGTKKFDFEKIDQLRPDLIIGNKEENYPEGIALLERKYPVWMSDVNSFGEAIQLIQQLGRITNRQQLSEKWLREIEDAFSGAPFFQRQRVLYVIWRDPWMAVANDTFIHAMLTKIGFENVLQERTRYPEIDIDKGPGRPDLILLSTEPFPFKEEHRAEMQSRFPLAKVLLVDGEMFSWYGSRLVKAAEYFKQLSF